MYNQRTRAHGRESCATDRAGASPRAGSSPVATATRERDTRAGATRALCVAQCGRAARSRARRVDRCTQTHYSRRCCSRSSTSRSAQSRANVHSSRPLCMLCRVSQHRVMLGRDWRVCARGAARVRLLLHEWARSLRRGIQISCSHAPQQQRAVVIQKNRHHKRILSSDTAAHCWCSVLLQYMRHC